MNRGLLHLLLCLLLAFMGTPAWAHCRPETRVGGFSEKPSDFASREVAKPIDTLIENSGCGYDFALSLHKYLYAQDDPVDGSDPSGEQDTMTELAVETGSATLDAFPNVVTVKAALVPLEKAQIVVTTEIRPGGPKPGVKSKQGLFVSSHGKLDRYFQFIGVTAFTYTVDTGVGGFDKGTSGDADDVTVYMGANVASAWLQHTPLWIKYEFEFDLNFVTHRGHLSGYNRQFPSYNVQVNGKQIYDFQQKHFLGLTGIGEVEPNVDFNF